MTTDWLLRVGDGENFKKSSKYKIWGIEPKTTKYFKENVKRDDRLWFVKSKSNGKLLAVATYISHNRRQLGPLIDVSLNNTILGWTGNNTNWDTEIHYTDLYGLNEYNLFTKIKGPLTIRKYNEKCKINLALEYNYIKRYCKITCEL